MFWERDILVKQEQMKDRLRRREEGRLLATDEAPGRPRGRRPRRVGAIMVVRALRRRLLAG